MKNIVSIILIVAAIGLFSYYIDPTYKEIGTLRAQEAEFAEALENTEKVQDLRNELQTKYNSFSQEDHERLTKLLPDSVDNVRLIIEIDAIASRHNMEFENVQTSDTRPRSAPTAVAGAIGAEAERPYAAATLSFTIAGAYGDFLNFLQDLERSLRIMDMTNVDVTPDTNDSSEYTYKIQLRTYWLKPLPAVMIDAEQYVQ